MNIQFTDNSKEVSDNIKAALLRGLETCGLVAEGYAKKLAPVDTGNLRNSITHTVDGQTALRMAAFYPEWAEGQACAAGYKAQRGGKLWRCLQAHTAQNGWEPENAASLWEQICETHDGTKYDPIPYEGNMALESGKHYTQSGMTYLCSRDTVNPVYNALSELVGIYVEVVNG